MSLLQLLQRLDTNRALTVYLLKRMLTCFYHICACVTFVYCTSKDTWRPETQGQFHCTSPPGLALLKECGSGKANSCRTFMRKCWPQWVWNFPGSDTGTRDSNGVQVFLAWYERQLYIHSHVSGSLGTCHSGLCSTFALLWQSSRGSGGKYCKNRKSVCVVSQCCKGKCALNVFFSRNKNQRVFLGNVCFCHSMYKILSLLCFWAFFLVLQICLF